MDRGEWGGGEAKERGSLETAKGRFGESEGIGIVLIQWFKTRSIKGPSTIDYFEKTILKAIMGRGPGL